MSADGRDYIWCLLCNPRSIRLAVIIQGLWQVASYVIKVWRTDNMYIMVTSLLCLSSKQTFMRMLCLCKHIIYALPHVQTQNGLFAPASLQIFFLDVGTTAFPSTPSTTPTAPQSIHATSTPTSIILPQDSTQLSTVWSSSLPTSLPSHTYPYRYLCLPCRCTVWHWTDLSTFNFPLQQA